MVEMVVLFKNGRRVAFFCRDPGRLIDDILAVMKRCTVGQHPVYHDGFFLFQADEIAGIYPRSHEAKD